MTRPITPLRQRMLDDMTLRNMAAASRRTYVRSVAGFSAFHGRSPDELTLEDVRDYQLHLVARGLKASTICQITSALRFLYAVTLDRPEEAARIPLPRKADPLPAILSREEVARLLGALGALAYQNKARVYGLLLKAAAETLTTIAADPKHLGAMIARGRELLDVPPASAKADGSESTKERRGAKAEMPACPCCSGPMRIIERLPGPSSRRYPAREPDGW